MNKREVLLSLLDENARLPYIPAAFFLHFGADFHTGQAAVNKHLDFFRYTGMDFVKIQYEKPFPHLPHIEKPRDWAQLPHYDREFFAEQLAVIEGLVKAAKPEALILVTLYSPYMCAAHTTSHVTVTDHLNHDPELVRPGLEIITDSLLGFVRACIEIGVDGFYHSTQGGEAHHFEQQDTFERYIKPYDLILMQEINQACPFNILHVCDYERDYADFSAVRDYPGSVVNAPLHLGDRVLTPQEVARQFGRPFMGGLERKGVLATGTETQIRTAVEAILREAPERFILAADCTVPGDTSWDNLKVAIDTAHSYLHSR
ncbi:MAG TPA: uroporphyrinogen decarboxylase family protein [Phototrophicaceae bacterium]|nr:uroporphyrinogen decarboxylase family protein [Phototrophicaceae bacterium]